MLGSFRKYASFVVVLALLLGFSVPANATTSTIIVAAGSTGASSSVEIQGSNKTHFNVSMNYYCFSGYATNVAPSNTAKIRVTLYEAFDYGPDLKAAKLKQASAIISFDCASHDYTWQATASIINGCGQSGNRAHIKTDSNYTSRGYTVQFNWSLT